MSTTTSTATKNNEAQKKEEKIMTNEVNAQAGKNTSLTAFQSVVDGIIKDFKADNQELEMIVAMLPVQDVLSIDNIKALLRGDKMLYAPPPRKNAGKDSKPTITSANQQRGALLEMLPHYAALVKSSVSSIALQSAELEKQKKAIKRALTMKELAALNKQVISKNASKSTAQLQIEAIEKMFARALAKVYFLRRVAAQDVTVDKKLKCIKYTGRAFSLTDKAKTHLAETLGEYAVTLAELSRDSKSMILADGVTNVRGNGKGASNKNAGTSTTDTAPAQLNPIDTTAKNAGSLAGMVKNIMKEKNAEQLAAFKKSEAPKTLFSDMIAALFVSNGSLDLVAFQKAMDVAIAKAKIGGKLTVQYAEPVKTEEKQSA